MGACTQAEAQKTIKPSKPISKAIIKDTKTQVVAQPIVPRAQQNAALADPDNKEKMRVRVHPQHELELNENVEEPWVCMGEEEQDGCQAENPQFQPGMGNRYLCQHCIFYLCEQCAKHYKN